MQTEFDTPLVVAGEQVTKTMRYSREDIAQFARLTFDYNPLHFDMEAAQRAQFGETPRGRSAHLRDHDGSGRHLLLA